MDRFNHALIIATHYFSTYPVSISISFCSVIAMIGTHQCLSTPTSQTSIGTQSCRTLRPPPAFTSSCFWAHARKASLAGHQPQNCLQTRCACIQVSAQSLSNVSLGTVYLVDHRPRTSIAAILGCSDIDCSKNGNKNNWTTWFLFCRTVHMELASNELKKPRYFDHCFQKSPQNISIQSIS